MTAVSVAGAAVPVAGAAVPVASAAVPVTSTAVPAVPVVNRGVAVNAVTTVAAVTTGVAVSAAATGVAVSGWGVTVITYDAIGPAVAVNPGVGPGTVATVSAAATDGAVSSGPPSRSGSSRRDRETHAENRHRCALSTVPHDPISCGNRSAFVLSAWLTSNREECSLQVVCFFRNPGARRRPGDADSGWRTRTEIGLSRCWRGVLRFVGTLDGKAKPCGAVAGIVCRVPPLPAEMQSTAKGRTPHDHTEDRNRHWRRHRRRSRRGARPHEGGLRRSAGWPSQRQAR